MEKLSMDKKDIQAKYKTEYRNLPAFDVVGFTKIVKSGGEHYNAVRRDGRWEVLRNNATKDGTIYGIASLDKNCPKGYYRYTLGIIVDKEDSQSVLNSKDFFKIHINQSGWVVFELENFNVQYGILWSNDAYCMVKTLGYEYNKKIGVHIDVFLQSYLSEHDAMKFMMPVKDLN